jgi:hypothetical protein
MASASLPTSIRRAYLQDFVEQLHAATDRKSARSVLVFFVDAYDVLVTGTPRCVSAGVGVG